MYGPTALDLAPVLAAAHRDELTRSLRTRPGPPGALRVAMGRRFVRTGLRLLGQQADRRLPSAEALGT